MFDNWMSVLQSGKYETLLGDVTISRSAGETHRGVGRLTWSDADGITFVAETENEGDPLGLDAAPFQPGQIMTASEQFRLTAVVQNGWDLETSHFFTQPAPDLARRLLTWKQKSWWLTLSSSRNHGAVPHLIALVNPVKEFVYPKLSEIQDNNPYFGGPRKPSDWFEHETTFGRIVVRRAEADSAHVLIRGDLNQHEFENALESVRLALSFVEGRSLNVVGFEASSSEAIRRRIYHKLPVPERSFAPPLMDTMQMTREAYGPLLGKAIDFFHTKKARVFSDQLRMCWAMSDNYASQRAFAACAAVESLVEVAESLIQEANVDAPQLKPEEIHAQAVIRRFLSAPRRKLSPSFVGGIDRCFENMNHLRPIDIIRGWSERAFLGIGKADVKAWSELRNPVAHGTLCFQVPEEESPKLKRKLEFLTRVENMVNKLVLFAMGYEGCYFDYVNYKASHFPPDKNEGKKKGQSRSGRKE